MVGLTYKALVAIYHGPRSRGVGTEPQRRSRGQNGFTQFFIALMFFAMTAGSSWRPLLSES